MATPNIQLPVLVHDEATVLLMHIQEESLEVGSEGDQFTMSYSMVSHDFLYALIVPVNGMICLFCANAAESKNSCIRGC